MRRHFTSAHAIAFLALFVALGGTGYAVSQLPKDSVGAAQIRKDAVTSKKVRNGSLLARDFKSGQLPRGETGPAGPLLDELPSGRTLIGSYSLMAYGSDVNTRASATISFPLPLASSPAKAVVLRASSPNPDAVACPGSASNPKAAPGALCVYEAVGSNAGQIKSCNNSGVTLCGPGAAGSASRFGADIEAFASAAGTLYSAGTWAVTAP